MGALDISLRWDEHLLFIVTNIGRLQKLKGHSVPKTRPPYPAVLYQCMHNTLSRVHRGQESKIIYVIFLLFCKVLCGHQQWHVVSAHSPAVGLNVMVCFWMHPPSNGKHPTLGEEMGYFIIHLRHWTQVCGLPRASLNFSLGTRRVSVRVDRVYKSPQTKRTTMNLKAASLCPSTNPPPTNCNGN